ncbi:MAG: hypothetical protein ABEH81_04125 [Halopenitus sp.]
MSTDNPKSSGTALNDDELKTFDSLAEKFDGEPVGRFSELVVQSDTEPSTSGREETN